jgi:4-amino-4-deoxy-L-arabinose transferase-like glycosyltransferase
VIPFGLLILWCITTRSALAARGIRPVVGPLVLLALTIPWHVAAAMKVPGFFAFYIVDNQFLRFFGSRAYVEDQQSPLGTLAFLGVTAIALFPWTPCLTAALTEDGARLAMAGWRRWYAVGLPERAKVKFPRPSPLIPHDSRMLFLLSWAALIIGGFSLSSFKLEYYTLPAFPALAILTAAFLGRLVQSAESMEIMDGTPRADASTRVWGGLQALRVWIWIATVGGLLFTTGAVWALWVGFFSPEIVARGLALWATNYRIMLEQRIPIPMVSGRDIGLLLLAGGLIWTVGYAVALGWLRRRRILLSALAVAGVGTVLCFLTGGVLGQVESHHSLKPLAAYLNGVLRSTDFVVHERGLEKGGGLLFYTGRKVLVLNGTHGDLEFGSGLPGYERAFIDTEAFRTLWQSASRVFLVTHLPRALSAISVVSAPTPILVARTGTRWLYANSAP